MQHLSPYQKKILEECLEKKNGGLSIPMGSGKTLLSIVLGLELNRKNDPYNCLLIVCAKSLIHNWTAEIKKFFDSTLEYQILHANINKFELGKNTKIVITTPEVIAKQYDTNNLSSKLIRYETTHQQNTHLDIVTKFYNNPKECMLKNCVGGNILYGKRWGCLIIDEIQTYTNIQTKSCQGIISIFANYRWGLSGTMFNEPKIERILGYYALLDVKDSPRSIPDMVKYIRHSSFEGLSKTTVSRELNEMFTPPEIKTHTIVNALTSEEEQLYISSKQTLTKVNKKVKELKEDGDVDGVRKFNSYLLAMITYLRQSLVCPLIPITNVAIDMADFNRKSDLSEIFTEEIKKLNLEKWLNSEESVKSSRITKVLEQLEKHPKERILIFSSFRTTIDMLMYFIKGREAFSITSKMDVKTREKTQKDFEKSENGILLLTYELGSSGLNLQSSSVVMLVDFWWNGDTTKQAIARILRYGQQSKVVNVYYFTSNTGLEKAVFEKHISKFKILGELKSGPQRSKISRISVKEIIKIINEEDNLRMLEDILKY